MTDLAELRRAVERLSGRDLDRALDAAMVRDFALAERILAGATVRRRGPREPSRATGRRARRSSLLSRPRAAARAC